MITTRNLLRRLAHANEGAMAIETAIVAPILLMLSLGGVEAGAMVARQSELQSAAAEALNIVQAAPPKTQAARNTVRDILKTSTGITDNSKVTVIPMFRCDTDAEFVDEETDCNPGDFVSKYIQITLVDTYSPRWTAFGIGSEVDYNVVRTVQIS
jgi:Flp pilus assembly protein TadG